MNTSPLEASSELPLRSPNPALGESPPKVASSKYNKRQWLWWLALGVIMLFILWPLFHHHRTTVPSKSATVQPQDFQHDLNANLAAINAMNQQMKTQLNTMRAQLPPESQHALEQPPEDKEYLARQNANTTLYHRASTQSTQGSNRHGDDSDSAGILAGNDSNDAFVNHASEVATAVAIQVKHPDFTVMQGEMLPAVLETAIQSDLPGMVRAVVTTPVYAYTGQHLLLPAGSRLIGQYASSVVRGQSRILIVWNRVILPNGISVQIDSPGVDALGRAGQGADIINTHFWARFGNATLLSLIGAGAANAGVDTTDQYNASQAYRSAVAESFSNSANDSLKGNRLIPVTLHIHQGAQINVFVARDLSFYRVLHPHVSKSD